MCRDRNVPAPLHGPIAAQARILRILPHILRRAAWRAHTLADGGVPRIVARNIAEEDLGGDHDRQPGTR